MKAFFEKYEVNLTEYDAIKVMHHQIECVKKAYKENKNSDEYLRKLKMLHDQIEDFFEAKDLEMEDY